MAPRKKFKVEPLTASPAGGKLIAVVGTPNDGDVPTFNGANNRYEPAAGGGGGGSTFGLVFVFPEGSTAGSKVRLPAPVDGDFAVWWARLDQSGSATFTVRHASGVTGSLASVGGTAPSVSSALGAEDINGLDWTTTGFSFGDIIEVELASITTATGATLTLGCIRT
jgi:hypothetical protein